MLLLNPLKSILMLFLLTLVDNS